MDLPEEQPLKINKNNDIKTQKSIKEKLQQIKENITVEPVLVCYIISNILSKLAIQNLDLEKACRVNLEYGDSVCDTLIVRQGSKYLKEELAVQELIAALEGWKSVFLTAVPTFLILFLGAWSDRTSKRKICILIPIVGELLMCLSNILNVYYFNELSLQVTMFLGALFPAVTGGWIVVFMGVFSYISDVSSEDSRTFRIGVANLCVTTGIPIGSALSGILLNKLGYYGVFTVCSVLYLYAIWYGSFFIIDPVRSCQDKKNEINGQSRIKLQESFGIWGFIKSFFDLKHIKDTLTVVFKNEPNHRRIKTILILTSIVFISGPTFGEYHVVYLFTRYRFNWDALKYSYYNIFHICLYTLGQLISISLFSRHFQWDDSIIGLISTISKIGGCLTTALAKNSLQMYIAVAVEMFNITSVTAMRSISSKLVGSDELGKMTSIYNLLEVMTSMVFNSIYSWIYMATVKIDAGIVYYVSTVLTVPAFLIFMWFFIQHKKDRHEVTNQDPSDTHTKYAEENKEHLLSSIDVTNEKVFM